ncbi:MAG: hypothetical protein M3P11_00265 [Actinomycetota bacterium]|nr:hypothetical protein [Actinomycetota bacterium]
MNWVADDDPVLARALFGPPSVVLGARPGRGDPMTSFMWPSFRRFSGTPASWFRAYGTVVYDPENWEATPLREREHPADYFRQFGALGHSYGIKVLITPHPGLVTVEGADCSAQSGESEIDAFLRCDLMGQAARYADMVEVQAQQLEGDTSAYRSFVERAAAQARTANPHVLVIAGLSPKARTTAGQMYEAWNSVRDLVDGYYLSISVNERVPTALAFLHMLPLPEAVASPTSSDG